MSVSFLLPSCEEIPPEALPASDTTSSPKSDMPASEPFISKRTVGHSSNCEFVLKIYHFLSFWKSLSSTKTYLYPNALRYLCTNLSFDADVSEKTLPFVSQSIDNFSDYNISQSDDWEYPFLSLHVLLLVNKKPSRLFVWLCLGQANVDDFVDTSDVFVPYISHTKNSRELGGLFDIL